MKYLTLVLLLAAAAPAAGQTARIAHFSHSGSLETLDADAAADNFGVVPKYFVADSVKFLSDTTVLEYGKWQGSYLTEKEAKTKTKTLELAGQPSSQKMLRADYLDYLHRSRSVKIIDNTTPKNTQTSPTPPARTRTKRRRKESALAPVPTVPGGPAVPGGMLLGAGVLLLAGAGWLLTAADKRPLASA